MTPDTGHKSIRCFLALTIPKEAQNGLAGIQKSLEDNGAKARWVKPENIHITLRFLGDRSFKKVRAIAESLASFCPDTQSFKITSDRLDGFPDINNPKVVWAGISEGERSILALYHAVNEALARLGIPKEREAFIPHLTIARCKTIQESCSTSQAAKRFRFSPIQTMAASIAFYKSTLTSDGAMYELIQECSLK
ncbi:MAG TPA: RNA 2',3'-cyclic phosphodiesterase [Candidatus Omnitrophota bacterium]|nr:RNA 2',3'-cyclic phosphodiesterase [Candidatus Omnitrophota bacterium]